MFKLAKSLVAAGAFAVAAAAHAAYPERPITLVVDLLQTWCGSDGLMDRILVENPALLYGFAS